MDLKTPGSGEVERNLWSNIDHLTTRDEVKFVIGSREDYEWSCDQVRQFNLPERCGAVLFSPIFGRIEPRQIVEWILADRLDVSLSAPDAQVHLDPDAARSVKSGTGPSP